MLQRNQLAEHEFPLPAGETVGFTFDWRLILEREPILTSVFVADGGIAIYGDVILDGADRTSIYVSNAVKGLYYKLTNTITTATQTISRSITLECEVDE